MMASRFIFLLFLALLGDAALVLTIYFRLPNTAQLAVGAQMERRAANGKIFSFVAGPKNKKYVRVDQIPKHFKNAVIALEDARFYQHYGFDLIQIQKVLEDLEDSSRPRGASSITQQLAKNLYLSSERSMKRKVLEALITLKLEAHLSKAQILELYINSIDWGRGLFGISDAATYYFKKPPSALTIRESIFLASIIPNPSRFGKFDEGQLPKQFVRTKMMIALKELYRTETISFSEFEDLMEHPYKFTGDEF